MLQKKTKLSFKVCCYLQSQKVWAGIIKNQNFKKSCCLNGIVNRSNISKKYFMLILGVTFLAPSQYSFPRLQLHVTKKYEMIFVPLCFYLRLLKKSSKSVSQIFKILFRKMEIVILLSFVVSFVMSNIC